MMHLRWRYEVKGLCPRQVYGKLPMDGFQDLGGFIEIMNASLSCVNMTHNDC